MKKNIFVVLLALVALVAPAQVANRCLKFDGGTVNCGSLPELNGLTDYTIQFWIKPNDGKWAFETPIFNRGETFILEFGQPSKPRLRMKVGGLWHVVEYKNEDLDVTAWNQITIVVNENNPKIYINNTPTYYAGGQTAFGSAIPSTEDKLILGGEAFSGLIDEFRIWGCALPDDFERFAFTTVNQYTPNWDKLLVYYKMDQQYAVGGYYEERLVDYKEVIEGPANKGYNNHGLFNGKVEFVNSDNKGLPYTFHSGYLDNVRLFDTNIPREQYLLYNELIIRGAQCDPSVSTDEDVIDNGAIYTLTPNNHAKSITGGSYIEKFERRTGVLGLDGNKGSRIELSDSTFYPSPLYTFESWIYLDEWTSGGYILRRETEDKNNGIAIFLGEDEGTINIRINGVVKTCKSDAIVNGKWFYFAISGDNDGTTIRPFAGDSEQGLKNIGNINDFQTITPAGNENTPIYMGEGLKCKFDNVLFWKKLWWINELKANMGGEIPMPGIGIPPQTGILGNMTNADTYLTFDDPENLCFSSHSQDSWLKIIKSAYEGHTGVKFFLSVYGSDKNTKYDSDNNPIANTNWKKILNQETIRKKFAERLAALSKDYDGVVLDLEWPNPSTEDKAGSWGRYSLLIEEIKKSLPEGKELRVAASNSVYTVTDYMKNNVDAFTFHQFGDNEDHFNYTKFTEYIQEFKNNGFSGDQIIASYSANTSLGMPLGMTTWLDEYTFGSKDDEFVSKNEDGNTHCYMTPGQAYQRAKHAREQGLKGIFNSDISAEFREKPAAAEPQGLRAPASTATPSLALHAGMALGTNVDPYVGTVTVNHLNDSPVVSGVTDVAEDMAKSNEVKVNRHRGSADAFVTIGDEPAVRVALFDLAGRLVEAQNGPTVSVDTLTPGIYIVAATAADGRMGKAKLFLN